MFLAMACLIKIKLQNNLFQYFFFLRLCELNFDLNNETVKYSVGDKWPYTSKKNKKILINMDSFIRIIIIINR